MIPAILFEPDGYMLDGPKLMGRQAAGNSFLRAVIDKAVALGPDNSELFAWTHHQQSADVFKRIVSLQAPVLKAGWVPADRADLLRQIGGLYLPGPNLSDMAYRRLRNGSAAWSLTGITHTLCSHTAMDGVVRTLEAPVMPWDALVCTSTVAKKVVSQLFDLQGQYLLWRFGANKFKLPKLPVIPLGVHARDFAFSDQQKKSARKRLGFGARDVGILFAGRLSFHAKAHPYPMLIALQERAKKNLEPIHLVLCGQFPNDAVKGAFIDGAHKYAPDVAVQWVDGKDFGAYADAWAGCDIFVSLSDNLQETFGITPLEAMASGMPVLVSDWNGYKDTVVDGETGFRIPTWMPPPDLGAALAAAYEAGSINYDRYIGLACLDVSIDLSVLVDRLDRLVGSESLRRQMGVAGRERVRSKYDWPVVMDQYIDLWQELSQIRARALLDKKAVGIDIAPVAAPARQDPYRVFASFPTFQIGPKTRVSRSSRGLAEWDSLKADSLFEFAGGYWPNGAQVSQLVACLVEPCSVGELSQKANTSLGQTIKTLSALAKADWVTFEGLGSSELPS